jgi:hypothetical protein
MTNRKDFGAFKIGETVMIKRGLISGAGVFLTNVSATFLGVEVYWKVDPRRYIVIQRRESTGKDRHHKLDFPLNMSVDEIIWKLSPPIDKMDADRFHGVKDWVMIKVPDRGPKQASSASFFEESGPRHVVLDTGAYVWVDGSYSDELPEGVKRITDGRSEGYSGNGDCLLSVPADWCTFYSAAEADSIEQCTQADADMLANAR